MTGEILHRTEAIVFWAALVGYAISSVVVIAGTLFRRRPENVALALMTLTVFLHTAALALRWWRLGHVPVGSMFELLSGNAWGLMVALTFAYWRLPAVRPTASIGLPVILMLLGWMLLGKDEDSSLPRTYDTVWLFIHIGFIKLFLGCSFVATIQSIALLARRHGLSPFRHGWLPEDGRLIELAFSFLALGWIFDSIGIIAGAIWSNSAWGRYWAWDPLETWALLTWISIGIAMHAKSAFKLAPPAAALLVIAVFVIAFMTFFGVPFVSTALHKGAI